MQPAFAALLIFEVFNGVRQITILPLDSSLPETFGQNGSSWSNEGAPCNVLLVTGLFANENEFGDIWAFTKHELRCIFIEVATLTFVCLMLDCA